MAFAWLRCTWVNQTPSEPRSLQHSLNCLQLWFIIKAILTKCFPHKMGLLNCYLPQNRFVYSYLCSLVLCVARTDRCVIGALFGISCKACSFYGLLRSVTASFARSIAGSPSGRQRWRERRVGPCPRAQLSELLQPGFWEGAPTAGPRCSRSSTACGRPRSGIYETVWYLDVY